MSKRKGTQRSVVDLWAAKRKPDEASDDDGDTDSRDDESDFGGSKNPMPSKHNHNIQFDLNMERVECANGTDLFFDFVFHLPGTSANQINIECGDRELASASTSSSNLRVHIEGTAHENVELRVKVSDNRKHKRK